MQPPPGVAAPSGGPGPLAKLPWWQPWRYRFPGANAWGALVLGVAESWPVQANWLCWRAAAPPFVATADSWWAWPAFPVVPAAIPSNRPSPGARWQNLGPGLKRSSTFVKRSAPLAITRPEASGVWRSQLGGGAPLAGPGVPAAFTGGIYPLPHRLLAWPSPQPAIDLALSMALQVGAFCWSGLGGPWLLIRSAQAGHGPTGAVFERAWWAARDWCWSRSCPTDMRLRQQDQCGGLGF